MYFYMHPIPESNEAHSFRWGSHGEVGEKAIYPYQLNKVWLSVECQRSKKSYPVRFFCILSTCHTLFIQSFNTLFLHSEILIEKSSEQEPVQSLPRWRLYLTKGAEIAQYNYNIYSRGDTEVYKKAYNLDLTQFEVLDINSHQN